MLVMAFLFGGISEYVTGAGDSPNGPASAHPFLSQGAGGGVSLFAWLVIMGLTLGMSILRWPQLVRPTAVCFLVKAVQNGLSIVASLAGIVFMILAMPIAGFASPVHLTAAAVSAVMIPATILNIVLSLSFLLFYLYLGRRAWRVDQEFRRLAAESIQSATIPWSRRVVGALAWAMAIGFAVSLIVWEAGVVTQQVVNQAVGAPKISGGPIEKANAALGLSMNELAWRQATDPDPAKRSADASTRECAGGRRLRARQLQVPRYTRRRALSQLETIRARSPISRTAEDRRLQCGFNVLPRHGPRPTRRARSSPEVVRPGRPMDARESQRRRRAKEISRGSGRVLYMKSREPTRALPEKAPKGP